MNTQRFLSGFQVFFVRAKEKNVPAWRLVHYLYLKKRYKVSRNNYFDNELYRPGEKKDAFFKSNNEYKRSWKMMSKACVPNASRAWLVLHRMDYFLLKPFYPGMDGSDYFHYEFYNFRHAKRRTFITEGHLQKMGRRLNSQGDESLLNNKAKFNALFPDIVTRKWLMTKTMTVQDAVCFMQGLDRAIAKPLDGSQGKGIYIVNFARKTAEDICHEFEGKNYILEEMVAQHPEIAAFNPSSVNTLRLYSVYHQGQVTLTCAAIRIGCGTSPIDNYSAGGMVAPVDLETGIIIRGGINNDAKVYYVHPLSGKTIIGFRIPCWEKVKDTVCRAHRRIPDLRYIAWDVVVCADGSVTFLEGNARGGVDLQQQPTMTGKKQLYEKYL